MYVSHFKSFRFRLVYILVWHLLSIAQMMYLYLVLNLPIGLSFADTFFHNILFACIGFAILPIVNYSRLDASNITNTLVTHLAAAALLISAWVSIGYYSLSFIFSPEEIYLNFLNDSRVFRVTQGVAFYFLLVLNYYLLIYYDNSRKQSVREAELLGKVKEAELSMLKSQLNPHFIFNSLNSLSYLTLTNAPKAQEMVINLANFLRFSLNSPDKLVTLQEELKAIEQYLSIEKVRFEERLDIIIDSDEESRELKLPSMVLQPIVENAVKYGVYESVKGNHIHVKCTAKNGGLVVNVTNEFEAIGVPKKGAGVGLNNVKERLKLVYSRDNLLTVRKTEKEFSVEIYVPQL
ncbi:MAG: two-component system LytT family sensor kinase [Spirosomataceae bacterium]|jgi:two-component system LytT family sensor kinase